MAMLERLMSHNQLSAKWQGLGYNVERWLTDFRHLGEILQQKQIELEGTLRFIALVCTKGKPARWRNSASTPRERR